MTIAARVATKSVLVSFAMAMLFPLGSAGSDSDLPWREATHTWTAKLGERPSGGPWLFGNVVLYLGYSGKLTALSAVTGDALWAMNLWAIKTQGAMGQTPAFHEDVVYLNASAQERRGGQLIAVEATSGRVRWTFATGAAPASRPLVAGDGVLIRTESEWIAVHRTTGKELWRIKSTGAHTYPPAIAGSIALLPDYGGQLRAVDSNTGKLKWNFLATTGSFPWREAFVMAASRAAQSEEGRRFFATSSAASIYVFGIQMCAVVMKGLTKDQILEGNTLLEPDVGQALWVAARNTLCPEGTSIDQLAALAKADEGPAREGVESVATVHHDKVFIRTREPSVADYSRWTGAVYVLDLNTGAIRFRASASLGGSPVGDDDAVYFMAVTDRRREMHAIDLSTSKRLWVADLSKQHVDERSRLMISEKFIYARDARIERKAGTVEARMPFDAARQIDFDAPSEAGEPGCGVISHYPEKSFVSRFDVANGKPLWAFSRKDFKNPGFRVACGEDSAFFYEDWEAYQYPVFGIRLR